MATGNISSSTPATVRPTGATAPLAAPAEAPAGPTPLEAAVPAAGDQVRVTAQPLKAGGTAPLAAYQPEEGEEDDGSFDTALTGSGIADTAQDLEGLPGLLRRRGAQALETATGATLVGSGVADVLDGPAPGAPDVEIPGALGSALTGTAGVLGAIDGANQYAAGEQQLAQGLAAGDTGLAIEGGTQMAVGATNAVGGTLAAYQGLTGLAASGANALNMAKAAQALAGQASKVAPMAATLGGIGSIASGAYELAQAFDAFGTAGELTPAEKDHKIINGSLNVVGGICMLVPGGQAVGAAILIGAAIYDNWDGICEGAAAATEKVAEVAEAVTEAVAEAVSETVSAAVDTVKDWGASVAKAFSGW